jgi:CHAD domain-containing protein
MDARLAKLRANAKLLAQMLDDVNRAPDSEPAVKTVHRLRTSTRRCGALLASLTGEGRPSRALEVLRKDAARLERQWKKMRRAAGGVRDLDVHREIVQKLRDEARPGEGAVASAHAGGHRSASASSPQAALAPLWRQLDAWLEKERHQRAELLRSDAAERGPKATALSATVLRTLTTRFGRATAARRATRSPALLALEDFAAVSAEMPMLDRDNLHDFRKRTKEARYLAEAGGDSAEAVSVARALKRIQDVIGDWHDRDALAREAEQALGKQGGPLVEYLRQLAATQMRQAIVVTERMRGRLLGERQALRAMRPAKRRRQRRPMSRKAYEVAAHSVATAIKFPAQATPPNSARSQSFA